MAFFDFDNIPDPVYQRRQRRPRNLHDHLMNRADNESFAEQMRKMREQMDINESGTENSSVPGFIPGGY